MHWLNPCMGHIDGIGDINQFYWLGNDYSNLPFENLSLFATPPATRADLYFLNSRRRRSSRSKTTSCLCVGMFVVDEYTHPAGRLQKVYYKYREFYLMVSFDPTFDFYATCLLQ